VVAKSGANATPISPSSPPEYTGMSSAVVVALVSGSYIFSWPRISV
jgi:hypothetical protein